MFLARNEVISNLCHWHDFCRLIVDRRSFAFLNYWGKQGSRARVRLYQRTKAGHWALVRGASCFRRRISDAAVTITPR